MPDPIQIVITEQGAVPVANNVRDIGNAAISSQRNLYILQSALREIEVGELVSKIVSLADTYAQLNNRLLYVSSSQDEATLAFGRLADIADKSRTSIEQTIDVYAKMVVATEGLGFSHAQTARAVQTLNEALILSGVGTRQSSSAVFQLAEGMAQNSLQGRQLLAVLKQMPAVADLIAHHMGITRGELKAFGTEGKITAQVVIDALVDASDQVDQQFTKIPETISQAVTVIKNRLLEFTGSLQANFGLIQDVTGVMDVFASHISGVVAIALGVTLVVAAQQALVYIKLLQTAAGALSFGPMVAGLAAASIALVAYAATAKISAEDEATAFNVLGELYDDLIGKTDKLTASQAKAVKASQDKSASMLNERGILAGYAAALDDLATPYLKLFGPDGAQADLSDRLVKSIDAADNKAAGSAAALAKAEADFNASQAKIQASAVEQQSFQEQIDQLKQKTDAYLKLGYATQSALEVQRILDAVNKAGGKSGDGSVTPDQQADLKAAVDKEIYAKAQYDLTRQTVDAQQNLATRIKVVNDLIAQGGDTTGYYGRQLRIFTQQLLDLNTPQQPFQQSIDKIKEQTEEYRKLGEAGQVAADSQKAIDDLNKENKKTGNLPATDNQVTQITEAIQLRDYAKAQSDVIRETTGAQQDLGLKISAVNDLILKGGDATGVYRRELARLMEQQDALYADQKPFQDRLTNINEQTDAIKKLGEAGRAAQAAQNDTDAINKSNKKTGDSPITAAQQLQLQYAETVKEYYKAQSDVIQDAIGQQQDVALKITATNLLIAQGGTNTAAYRQELIRLTEEYNNLTVAQQPFQKQLDLIKDQTAAYQQQEAPTKAIAETLKQIDEINRENKKTGNLPVGPAQAASLLQANEQNDYAKAMSEITTRFRDEQGDLALKIKVVNDLIRDGADATGAYAQELGKLKEQQDAFDNSVSGGLRKGVDQVANEISDVNGQISKVVVTSFNSMQDALNRFILTGKINFHDLVQSMANDMLKITENRLLSSFLGGSGNGDFAGTGLGLSGSLGLLFGGADTSGVASATSAADSSAPALIDAGGGAMIGLANGGSAFPGHTYIVGERHPELFTPNVGGTVSPNFSTNGGAPPQVHVHVHNYNDPKEIERMLASPNNDAHIVNAVRRNRQSVNKVLA